MAVAAKNYLKNLSSRYYCNNPACGNRVYPYERIMGLAELHNDDTGNDVLLFSLNNGIAPGLPKWAYCDNCEKYVQCNRVTNHDVILRRLEHNNIRFRLPEGTNPRSKRGIEQAIADYMART